MNVHLGQLRVPESSLVLHVHFTSSPRALYMLEPLPSAFSGITSTRAALWYQVAWPSMIFFVDGFLWKRRCIRCGNYWTWYRTSHLTPIIIPVSRKSTIERHGPSLYGSKGLGDSLVKLGQDFCLCLRRKRRGVRCFSLSTMAALKIVEKRLLDKLWKEADV